ncbi:DEAD/DEAH box helicase family protein [Staphylococcus sp. ACRSN]|uniref:DEAD/DEAH box helicase family protein n=1 Tax=Staphylococcus sp. ACRSN TaxID=2918214 RepID=UPI0031BBC0EC
MTDETVVATIKGVNYIKGKWHCNQCETTKQRHFYKYYTDVFKKTIVYCRKCIALGRMDNHNDIMITATEHCKSDANYKLSFHLTPQQQYASQRIVDALLCHQSLLLYAVTGSGKTEMIFEAIHRARKDGLNVAVVSPRIDVVVELSLRIQTAFESEMIDVLYKGQRQLYNGHFVIATIHQLMRFKRHFDFVIIDEVDAFPLSMDNDLISVVRAASTTQCCTVYMTATPSNRFINQFPKDQIIKLPARFHQHILPIPTFKYYKIYPYKKQLYFLKLLKRQLALKRYTLVFFHQIDIMETMYHIYKQYIAGLTYVHSQDALRLEKISELRKGKYNVIFTTTILERGFTMSHLDVIVIDSHKFKASALIQIAGRVGRKSDSPKGLVLYLHQGISVSMLKAKSEIKQMNTLARLRGWVND